MIPLIDLFRQYRQQSKALPSFNIDSFEIFQAVEKSVRQTGLPCLVQLSPNEDKFITAEKLYLLVRKANLEGLPLYLNLDHGQDLSRLVKSCRLGFDMIHFDGSSLSFADNLATATNLVTEVKSINPSCVVEVEFNHINLVNTEVSSDSYTSPSQALEFMTQSNADLLAVSVGNLHGVNVTKPESLDLTLLSQITSLLPQKMFTLHGGSGISPEQIKSAIGQGIVKININTDLRLCFLSNIRNSLVTSSSEKIYDYFIPAIDEVSKIITQKTLLFSSQSQA